MNIFTVSIDNSFKFETATLETERAMAFQLSKTKCIRTVYTD